MSGYRFDRLKILVVDDNAHMRKLVGAILRAFGVIQIYEAWGGEQAWKLVCEHNPDIVFLDWMLEGIHGVDLARMMRTSSAAPNPYIPIIMLTGRSDIESVQKARDAGVNEFLAKPVSAKAILTRMTAVIEHPRPFVRTGSYFGPCRRRRGHSEEYRGPERRASNEVTFEDPNEASSEGQSHGQVAAE